MKEVSATEASRNFFRMLDEVEQGEDFSITRHGVAIAMVAPVKVSKRCDGAAFTELLERLGPDPGFADLIDEGVRLVRGRVPRP